MVDKLTTVQRSWQTIDVRSGDVTGHLPARALASVQEWRILHQDELLSGRDHAQAGRPLPKIEPLE
jgi:hypothetical protein